MSVLAPAPTDTLGGTTGGTHLSLVIAGALGVSLEEAERRKHDPAEQRRLLPLVRPVMEKVASTVVANTDSMPTCPSTPVRHAARDYPVGAAPPAVRMTRMVPRRRSHG